MTKHQEKPKAGKIRGAQPYTSKTASFYQNQTSQSATIPPTSAQSRANAQSNNSAVANPPLSATSTLPPNSHIAAGAMGKPKATSTRSFKVALVSLFISLIGLSFIFAMQVEMKGAGAYLYLMVTVSAFVYIVATMFYVVLSTRRPK